MKKLIRRWLQIPDPEILNETVDLVLLHGEWLDSLGESVSGHHKFIMAAQEKQLAARPVMICPKCGLDGPRAGCVCVDPWGTEAKTALIEELTVEQLMVLSKIPREELKALSAEEWRARATAREEETA